MGNIMAGFYGGIAGCAMIGQTIVNVEMGKGRSRISTLAAGIVLLVLVTALSEVMAKIPMAVLAGIMAIVAVKTFSWHSVQPGTLKNAPVAETVVMLVTVVATVFTGNLAIGVLGGIVMMFILPARLKQKALATEEKSSPVQENKETAGIGNGGDHHARPHRGSRPSRVMVNGIITPIIAATSRFSTIASIMTPPSAISSYSHQVMPPMMPPQTRPLISATPIS